MFESVLRHLPKLPEDRHIPVQIVPDGHVNETYPHTAQNESYQSFILLFWNRNDRRRMQTNVLVFILIMLPNVSYPVVP